MAQIHLHAESGDYAPVVLLPGDPNRAKRIAARFDGGIQKARLVNEHRGLLGRSAEIERLEAALGDVEFQLEHAAWKMDDVALHLAAQSARREALGQRMEAVRVGRARIVDRKSTRLNSSH